MITNKEKIDAIRRKCTTTGNTYEELVAIRFIVDYDGEPFIFLTSTVIDPTPIISHDGYRLYKAYAAGHDRGAESMYEELKDDEV